MTFDYTNAGSTFYALPIILKLHLQALHTSWLPFIAYASAKSFRNL